MSESLYGVTPHLPAMSDADMAAFAATGASTVRITAAFISGGATTFGVTDSRVATAAGAGMKILMSLNAGTYPRGDIDWPTAVLAHVNRYKPGGAFWTANPTLVRTPIVYLIGNEPSLAGAPFTGTVANFAQMVTDTVASAHSAYAGQRVMIGGMTADGLPYLESVLRLVDRSTLFGVCYHPYFANPDLALGGVKQLRRLLLAYNWPSARMCIDEIGWTDASIGLSTQAQYLNRFFQMMRYRRLRWNIFRVLWYGYTDTDPVSNPGVSGYDYSGGLRQQGGAVKPSWNAFKAHASLVKVQGVT